jgi:hydrogenase expression/formation protein HypD
MDNILSFFRDPATARRLVQEIKAAVDSLGRPVTLMEVCGTHTMAISRWGLRKLLPANLKLLSGPGCPVCVTAQDTIDYAIELARHKDVIITTFGDMVKVPGSKGFLPTEKTRIVYAPTDALNLALSNPRQKVVFLGVGFETTAPTIAATIKKAGKHRKVDNFLVISAFKLVPPALRAILQLKKLKVDGLILPGHVSTIIGSQAYEFIARDFAVPCAITGFEPVDILEGIRLILRQIQDRKPMIAIQYRRVVQAEGNRTAQQVMKEVFAVDQARWRGLGVIPDSGLTLREEFVQFQAEKVFPMQMTPAPEPKGCICGQILTGSKNPLACRLFAKKCTPTNPVGPCMVSSEGSCAAYYKYERR